MAPNIDSNIETLVNIKKEPVFYAFEIFLTIKIFEVMIAGISNTPYISAIRDSLMDRIQPVIDIIERMHSDIKQQINQFIEEREEMKFSLFDHRKYEAKRLRGMTLSKKNILQHLRKRSK